MSGQGNRWRLLDDFVQDLRIALRGLARHRGFTIVAVITVAVGMTATASIASMANAVLWQLLAVPEPERLVSIWEQRRGMTSTGLEGMLLPAPRVREYREATRDIFSGLAAHEYTNLALRSGDRSQSLSGVFTSGNYFTVLGLSPLAGRFYADDREPGVVLSAALWRGRFNSDPGVIGQSIRLNSRSLTVLGVAPPGFTGVAWGFPVDIWVPAVAYAEAAGQSGDGFMLVPFGRLRPGIDRRQAEAQVAAIARRIPPAEPQTTVQGARLDPVRWRGDALPALVGFLAMLMITALLVLAIASANIAGMLTARAVARRRELAVRLAIGAGRGRLLREALTDSLLLFLLGGAGGVLLAFWGTRTLSRMSIPIPIPVAFDLTPDWRVLSFSLAVAALTGLLFGLGPALRATGIDVMRALKEGLGVTGGRSGRRRGLFVAGQLAISVLLLVTAALLARSLQRGLHANPGFDPHDVTVATTNLAPHHYDEPRSRAFHEALAARVRQLPGVEAAALANIVLLSGESTSNDVEDGDPAVASPRRTNMRFNVVDTAYFRTMRMELVAGRGFTPADRAGAGDVTVVNETLARRLWPGLSPLGRQLRMGKRIFDVIGVVRDGKYQFVTERPQAFAFLLYAQNFESRMALHVRSRLPSATVFAEIERAVQALDPNVALENQQALTQTVELSLFPQRIAADLIGLFGLAGLLLAAIGVYGVLAMHVAQRRREFGIRMALGASSSALLRAVLAQGALLALAGAGIGLAAAFGLTRFLRTLLYGVSPFDPPSFAAVPVLLLAVALLASLIPARRATRADPLEAMRQE